MEQKGYARKRGENVPTDESMISDNFSSIRYRRKKETKNILEFVHGRFEGSIYGAWNFLKSNAAPELMERLFLGYKHGKFLETLYGKFKENESSCC